MENEQLSSSSLQQVYTGYWTWVVTRAPVSFSPSQQPRSVPKNHTKWLPAYEKMSGIVPSSSWACPGIRSLGRMGAPLAHGLEPSWLRSQPGLPMSTVTYSHRLSPHDPKAESDIPRHGKGRKCHPCVIGGEPISCAGNRLDLGLAKLQAFSVDGLQGFPTIFSQSSV